MARYQFRFWLDANKDDELLLAEEIDGLKKQRSFTTTVRDGLRLMLDLRQGRVDMLFELFPWVQAAMQPPTPPDNDDLKREINFLKELMLAQHKSDGGIKMLSAGGPKPLQAVGGPKPLQTKRVTAPAYDDDEDTLVIRKDESSGERAALNFIRSAFAINGEPSPLAAD